MINLAENLGKVREQLLVAANNCGRRPEGITLVAISKTKPRTMVEAAHECGQTVFGENKVQEAADKFSPPVPGVELHMVGHLQSNKTKIAAMTFDRIHSLDSEKTARRLDKHLVEAGRTMSGLIQVNLAGEEQKSGVSEKDVAELLTNLLPISNLKIDGLMIIPPFSEDAENSRPYFRRLRELRDELNELLPQGSKLHHLSMGMTGDYIQAIEEGATFIRVGTAIFGARNYSN